MGVYLLSVNGQGGKNMSKTTKLMNNKKMTLIVSLPKNDLALAKCAWENGADAVKMHINLSHHASSTHFQSLELERPFITALLKTSPVPVGIVIADSTELAEEALNGILELPFDFISLYGHHMPISLGKGRKIDTFFAIDSTYSFEDVKRISSLGVADIIELSIQKKENYGSRLSLNSLLTYKAFAENSKLPTLLPSQLKLYPSDVKSLYDAGVKGIMIGAVVTGQTVESLKEAVISFRKAIDSL